MCKASTPATSLPSGAAAIAPSVAEFQARKNMQSSCNRLGSGGRSASGSWRVPSKVVRGGVRNVRSTRTPSPRPTVGRASEKIYVHAADAEKHTQQPLVCSAPHSQTLHPRAKAADLPDTMVRLSLNFEANSQRACGGCGDDVPGHVDDRFAVDGEDSSASAAAMWGQKPEDAPSKDAGYGEAVESYFDDDAADSEADEEVRRANESARFTENLIGQPDAPQVSEPCSWSERLHMGAAAAAGRVRHGTSLRGFRAARSWVASILARKRSRGESGGSQSTLSHMSSFGEEVGRVAGSPPISKFSRWWRGKQRCSSFEDASFQAAVPSAPCSSSVASDSPQLERPHSSPPTSCCARLFQPDERRVVDSGWRESDVSCSQPWTRSLWGARQPQQPSSTAAEGKRRKPTLFQSFQAWRHPGGCVPRTAPPAWPPPASPTVVPGWAAPPEPTSPSRWQAAQQAVFRKASPSPVLGQRPQSTPPAPSSLPTRVHDVGASAERPKAVLRPKPWPMPKSCYATVSSCPVSSAPSASQSHVGHVSPPTPAPPPPSVGPPQLSIPNAPPMTLPSPAMLDGRELLRLGRANAEEAVRRQLRHIAAMKDTAERRRCVREIQRCIHPDKWPGDAEGRGLATELFQVLQSHRDAVLAGRAPF